MPELCEDYFENVCRMDAVLNCKENFDLIKKVLYIGEEQVTFYYIDGLTESGQMNKLMIYLLSLKNVRPTQIDRGVQATRYFSEHFLPQVEVEVITDLARMVQLLLSGMTLLLGESFGNSAIVIDARSYPVRSVEEPENDRVMMGARDGFVETLIFNTALIRRRIRDPDLMMQHMTVGSKSKTDIVLCYLNGKADREYIERLKHAVSEIRTDALSLGHESLAESLIGKSWYNPFPKIRYTERPDVAAAQVLEGSVLILCDNSPEVMILPCSIFDFLQETNDFYFPPLTGTYIRIVRHMVFWATLLWIPIWFLFTKNPWMTPPALQFVLPKSQGRISVFAQLLLVEFVIDGLRMASMNTPSMLSNSLSIVGGLILGDFAVSIGWLIPEVILYMAFVSLAGYSQRSYELGYAFKFMRLLYLILIQMFDLIGFFGASAVILILLLSNRTANGKHSYLYPLIPFHGKALLSMFVRFKKDRFQRADGEQEKRKSRSAGTARTKKHL